MKHETSAIAPLPDDIRIAKQDAIVRALLQSAMADEDYRQALVVAACTAVGSLSVLASVPLPDLIALMQRLTTEAHNLAKRRLMQ